MVANTHNVMIHTLRCNVCGGGQEVFIAKDRWHDYIDRGMLVQDAFPPSLGYDAEYREQMIGIRSGYHVCENCWGSVFTYEEEE